MFPILILLFALTAFADGPAPQDMDDPHAGKNRANVDFKSRCRHFPSKDPEARKKPMVVVIPGGPGLGSETVETLKALSSKLDVCLLSPPGTDGTQALEEPTYDALVE